MNHTMDFDERDEMEFPGTSGTSGFAFDYFQNSESEEEDHDYMFLEPRSPDYLNSSMLIPAESFEETCSGLVVYETLYSQLNF